MTDMHSSVTDHPHVSEPSEGPAREIDASAWAVFFIWVGIVMLAAIPWSWFLIGVGAIMLATQAMRQMRTLKVEPFGVAMGLLLIAAGAWDLLSIPLPLIPILLILLGGYLLRKAILSGAQSR
ncbi:hypothetical protein [Bradyrhizobium nanningense]|uniref:hypothetical protein n=1 Tax=Bradyrhizobium nanningense TaxID=1325118 RepID=UPI001008B0DD|nr:hypothetical protein [Bradyrhizobium nanningense]